MNQISLPQSFLEEMKPLLQNNYDQFISSYKESPIRGLQVNELKINKDIFLSKFSDIEKIPYTKNGYYLWNNSKVGTHPLHHAGAFYMQEPSAMIVVNSIDIPKNAKVLDVCAAPGGKSIAIANQLQNTGVLVSNEINPKRSKILLSNMERMGIQNAIITNFSVNDLKEHYQGIFDMVFLDTPCSGEGMFRKDETAIQEWSYDTVLTCAKRSQELLETASHCVKTGGFLIYSTCTFAVEENEKVIENFLKQHDYELLETPQSIQEITVPGIKTSENTERCRRFYPHTGKGEGQFIAILKKKEVEIEKMEHVEELKPLSHEQQMKILSFLKDTLLTIPPLYQYHNQIITFPSSTFKIPDSHVIACGVNVGKIEKNHFEFHHQFASSYGNLFRHQLSLSLEDNQIEKYLHGEELIEETMPNGWGIVTIETAPVGLFKASQGRLKNHYPKGLRQ